MNEVKEDPECDIDDLFRELLNVLVDMGLEGSLICELCDGAGTLGEAKAPCPDCRGKGFKDD